MEEREHSAARGYGSRWQRFRERLFRERARNGGVVCAMCGLVFGAAGYHADHIQPVQSADDPLFYEPSNIQFLHPACHSQKTRQDAAAGLTRR